MKVLGKIGKVRLQQEGLTFNINDVEIGQDGRILVASGKTTRNRDWFTGKLFRIVPAGIRLSPFNRNPVTLWMHNHHIPLGIAPLFHDQGMVFANEIDFHRRTIPIASDKFIGDSIGVFDTSVIADLWDQRYLRAVSISIMFTDEDIENVVETEEEIVFNSSEAIEFSVVTIPADRDAIKQRMVKSFSVPSSLAELVVCEDGVCSLKSVTPHSASSPANAAGMEDFMSEQQILVQPGSSASFKVTTENDAAPLGVDLGAGDTVELEEAEADEIEVADDAHEGIDEAGNPEAEVETAVEFPTSEDETVFEFNADEIADAVVERMVARFTQSPEFIKALAAEIAAQLSSAPAAQPQQALQPKMGGRIVFKQSRQAAPSRQQVGEAVQESLPTTGAKPRKKDAAVNMVVTR